MIMAGNLVDHALKNGKIDVRESSSKSKGKGNFLRKKEGETQAFFQRISLTSLKIPTTPEEQDLRDLQ